MDNCLRDLSRLSLIYQMPIAQERFAIDTHLRDFVHYYFSRFVKNLSFSFKDFASSEIDDFNHQHGAKFDSMLQDTTLRLEGVIIPIPKGMIQSYRQTLFWLMDIVQETHPDTIKRDVERLVNAMGPNSIKDPCIDGYSKDQFDKAKYAIAKLYGKTGLTHFTALQALVSREDIGNVNSKLRDVTGRYYPDIVSLNTLLKTLEAKHTNVNWSHDTKIMMSRYLMIMAYRLSIFSTVMDHIQRLEHNFVTSMNILLKDAK